MDHPETQALMDSLVAQEVLVQLVPQVSLAVLEQQDLLVSPVTLAHQEALALQVHLDQMETPETLEHQVALELQVGSVQESILIPENIFCFSY